MTSDLIAVGTMFLIGLALSGYFSGTETGFYRVTRVRLVLDGLSGDKVSQLLLWLSNHPALFVATTLIGNNLANYLVSLSIVMGTQILSGGSHELWEIITPLAIAPVLFVYGELLPKNLFYLAPNRLLRIGGPMFLVFGAVFLPVSALLWSLGRFLERFVGASPESVHLRLARRELRQVLEEGHDAGILRPAQRQLAQGVFDAATGHIWQHTVPMSRLPVVIKGSSRSRLLKLAADQKTADVFVTDVTRRRLIGYVHVADLLISNDDWNGMVRELPELATTRSHLESLIELQSRNATYAQVVDSQKRSLGVISAEALIEPMMAGAARLPAEEEVGLGGWGRTK